jgi:hypothetical protein
MFRRFASNLLVVLGCIAFTIVGLGPRGAALCLGGGHDLGEMIVATCHGNAIAFDEVASDGCVHEAPECVLPHDHGNHDGEHAPCADIPLDQDEYRASGSTGLKHADDGAVTLLPLPGTGACPAIIAWPVVPRWTVSSAAPGAARERTKAMLRCVILQV